jgi:hypothetical protein
MFARTGDKQKALKSLKTAIDKGFDNLLRLKNQKDLDSLRRDPEFIRLLEIVKKRVKAKNLDKKKDLDQSTE